MAAGTVPGVWAVVMGLRDLCGLSVVFAPQCLLVNLMQRNTLQVSKKLDASNFNLPVHDCIEIGVGHTIAGGREWTDSRYTPEPPYICLQT